MKVTIIPIVIGAFGTANKGLLKGLEDLEVGGRVETTTLLRTVNPRGFEETCCHSNANEKPATKTDAKNSHNNNNKRSAEDTVNIF